MLHKCSYCEFILLQLQPGKIMYLPSHVPDIFQNIQIKLSLKIFRTYSSEIYTNLELIDYK